MAVTEQQFIDAYKGMSAEQQQKAYSAGNSQVRGWIDNYNKQNSGGNVQSTNTPVRNTTTPTNTTMTPTVNNNYQYGNGTPEQKGELKPLTYNYYQNDDEAAQDRIVNNLNDYWKNSPNLFTNYENFKNNFSYDARNDRQKKTLDDWRFGYDNSRKLNTRAVGDLTTMYKNGQLTDSDLNNLRYFYPDKYNEVMNKINSQNDMAQYSEMLYGTTDTGSSNIFNQLGEQMAQNLLYNGDTGSINYYEEYQNEINTEEMHGWSDRLVDLQTEIDKINSDLNSLYKDIEKRYEGTGASTAKIQAVYADEAYDLQIQRNSLALEQQSLASKYNSRLQEAQNNFNMKLQQYNVDITARNQKMKEMGFAMELINFETNAQADERAFKNWARQIDYQYGNIDSTDPTARRKAVDNAVSEILDKYSDIPMQRSKDQMVEDVLQLVDGGMKLGEALTQNIITPIQSKPEYINWYNNKLGVDSPVSYQMGADGKLTIVGGKVDVPIGTTGNNYKTIDLNNGYAVSVDPNKVITINGQGYRITQLGGNTATSGIDFAPAVRGDNQEVQAFVGGQVIRSGTDKNTGNKYVEILGDNGYVYRYNHLNDWDTDYASGAGGSPYNGQRVEAGTVIGHMGQTGKASGVHLDLAVYDGSRANSMAVSPLNIKDQAKVFFNSVEAQGLGIGSIGGGENGDWELVYEAAKKSYGESATYWKSDEGKKTATFIENMAKKGFGADEILDSLRVTAEDPLLTENPAVNSNMKKIFSSLSISNQNKAYNFKDLVEDYLNDGDWDGVLEEITTQALSLDKTTQKEINAYTQTIQTLADVNSLYQEYLAEGGKGWIISGTWNDLKVNMGKVSGNKKLAEISTRLENALNSFVKGMSGLTVSDQERKRYEKIFPNTKMSSERFMAQVGNLMTYFEDGVNGRYGNILGAKQYQALQDWYKGKTGKYYSFAEAYSGGIYRSNASSKIDIDWSGVNGGSNVYNSNDSDINFILYGF